MLEIILFCSALPGKHVRLACLGIKYHWNGIVQPYFILEFQCKRKEIATSLCLWNQILYWKRYNLWLHHLSNLTFHYIGESKLELDIFLPGWNQLLFGKVALVNKAFRILGSEKKNMKLAWIYPTYNSTSTWAPIDVELIWLPVETIHADSLGSSTCRISSNGNK